MLFNVVPAGKQLLITDVACRVRIGTAAPARIHVMALMTLSTTNAQTDRQMSFNVPLPADEGNVQAHAVSATTRQLLRAGERPVIYFQATTQTSFGFTVCSIAGKVGNPPE